MYFLALSFVVSVKYKFCILGVSLMHNYWPLQ